MTSNFKSAPSQNAPWSRRISPTHIAAGLGVLLLFDLAFYLFAVRPLDAREEETIAAVATLETQVKQRGAATEQLRDVVVKVETARSTGDGLIEDITIRRQIAFSTLVVELDAAASGAQIEDRDRTYDIEPVDGTEDYGIIRMNANFRGRYKNIVRFLNLIDRSEQFVIIESLGASPRSESADLQVTMRIDTFVRDLEGGEGR